MSKPDNLKQIKATERALQKTQAQLQAMFDCSNVGFLFLNADYTVLSFNHVSKNWATVSFGVDLKEGINFKNLIARNRVAGFEAVVEKVLTGKEVSYETNCPKTDGHPMWYKVTAKPLANAERKIIGVCLAITDTTHRKQAEDEIAKLKTGLAEQVKDTTQLEEANTALEEFSYSVSHDLRSPLSSVMGFTQIISKEYAHDFNAELKELFERVEHNSKRMSTILEDLLNLAKYGKEKLHITPVNTGKLFIKVSDTILFATAHKAAIEINPLPVVEADGSMLEQVIINLIANAVKYSSKKEKPLIKVGCTQTTNEFTFYVKDNGAGFDMQYYHRLFSPFQRLHSLSDFDGTGVGLVLVKRIIEKHGGRVWAEGKVGEGAVFYFTLPKSVEPQNPGEARRSY